MKIFRILTILCFSGHLFALDLPQFYRARFFEDCPKNNVCDYATFLSVRGASGRAKSGFINDDDKTNILSIWGPTNFNTLGLNVENPPDPCTDCFKPLTKEWLQEGGIIPSLNFTCNDGKARLLGKFKTDELDFELHQNITKGFFAKAYVPIKKLKIKDIEICNLTNPDSEGAQVFQGFLNDTLNPLLCEWGISPVQTPFHKTGVGDIAIFGGWQGYDNESFKVLKDLSGYIMLGLTIPTGEKRSINKIVSLPMGYDGFWGVVLRGGGESAFFTRHFVLGGAAGAIIFFNNNNRKLRLKTTQDQQGIIYLQPARTDFDKGSIWDATGYMKIEDFFGFTFLIGGSYTKQEKSKLDVKDDTFLRTLVNEQREDPSRTSKNKIINSDKRFDSWWQGVLHLLVEYDAKKFTGQSYAPKLSFFYDIPLVGRRSFDADMIGGMLGISVDWNV